METGERNAVESENKLGLVRGEIVKSDRAALEVLVKRFGLSKDAAKLKRVLGMDIEDPGREIQLKLIHEEIAIELGLSVIFVRKLFDLIIEESKRIQTEG